MRKKTRDITITLITILIKVKGTATLGFVHVIIGIVAYLIYPLLQ